MILEPEQEEVLSILVEASRNLPNRRREPFVAFRMFEGPNFTVNHGGLAGGTQSFYDGDLEVLEREQFIAVSDITPGTAFTFNVIPRGYAYYRELKQRSKEAFSTIEDNLRHYLNADRFSKKYPAAYQKLRDAEALLWESDSERKLTTIGHICREALQEFATSLVEQHPPPDVNKDKAKTVNRLKSVIRLFENGVGESGINHLNALVEYWRTVDALIQRQEHGGQKEGEPLIWEDGRRAVFQTGIVMYEIDSCLLRVRSGSA